MPKTAETRQASEGVALIGDPDAVQEIAAALQTEQLLVEGFASAETLLDDAHRPTPAGIVLWSDGRISAAVGTIESLRSRFPDSALLLVCTDIRRWEIRAALLAGAGGVVLLPDVHTALAPSLRAVQVGQTAVPQAHSHQIDPPVLSAREKQILGLVVMGYMNSEIATRLFLAESTVKSHLSSAFGKLGVRSRNEAVNLILDPEGGLGMGILSLGVEPLAPTPTPAS